MKMGGPANQQQHAAALQLSPQKLVNAILRDAPADK